MSQHPSGRTLYRAFIDETGDRGTHAKSSAFFCFAAVVLRDEYMPRLRNSFEQMCGVQNRGPGAKLKWRDMNHYHRRHATECLAAIPLRILYVIVPKATLRGALARDHGVFYNYAARILVERISWMVDDTHGICKLTFERVKGYPERVVIDYLALLRGRRNDPEIRVRWDAIHPTVRVDSPANVRPLCAADIAVGALDSAIRPHEETGFYEPAYLTNLATHVWRSGEGPNAVLSYGLKLLTPSGLTAAVTTLPWWPGPFA